MALFYFILFAYLRIPKKKKKNRNTTNQEKKQKQSQENLCSIYMMS